VSRAAAINDALRPAGRVPAAAGSAAIGDESCPDCGFDVLRCSCEAPAPEAFSADEVMAELAELDRRRAKAVASERVALGLAKDRERELRQLKQHVAALEAAQASAPAPVAGSAVADYLARLTAERRAWAEQLIAGTVTPSADVEWHDRVARKVARYRRIDAHRGVTA
jgi:hypothetical protein